MRQDRISLSHGSGGSLMADLIDEVFIGSFGNKILGALDDAARLNLPKNKIAFTTDSYTVKPLFFPGGDIGKLAVCGTLNDLSVMGAKPLAISVSFIIEEGFLISDLRKIVGSMAAAAKECGVWIVTGDTKVVGRKEADGLFINTSGVGTLHDGMSVSCRFVKEGDAVILSGEIAEHGVAILDSREKLGLEPKIKSDVACVYHLIKSCLGFSKYIHAMRDPTRGGLVSVLNEIARASGVGIKICENDIPVKKEVVSACDLLGLDYLSMANEGKVVFFVDSGKAKSILSRLRKNKLAKKARIIGRAVKGRQVFLETRLGTKRLLPLLEGEALPRIC